MLPTFHIFGLNIPMFGTMMLIGMLAAFLLLWRTRRIIPFTEDDLLSGALWAIILGFIGAKLLFWIVEFDQVLADPAFLAATLREGFVFYGALIGGVLGVFICSRRKKLPFLAYIDLFAPSLVLAHAFGRIGCFMAGCCYGCPTDGFLGVVFPANSAAPAGISLLPTQLFESAFLFILTIVLVWLLKKRRTFGTVTGWYLVLYGVWRFFIEFYRSDDRGAVGLLSTSQFIGIFMVAAGAVLLILIAKGIVSRGTLPVEEFSILEDEVTGDEAAEEDPKTPEPPAKKKAARDTESPEKPKAPAKKKAARDTETPETPPKAPAKKKAAPKVKDAPANKEEASPPSKE